MHTPVRNESKQTTAQFPLWHLPLHALHCPSTRWRNFWGIILIPGPFRIQSHNQFWIILDLFYFIRNGAVWSCASIISACAVSFTLILLRDWHEWWVIQDWVSLRLPVNAWVSPAARPGWTACKPDDHLTWKSWQLLSSQLQVGLQDLRLSDPQYIVTAWAFPRAAPDRAPRRPLAGHASATTWTVIPLQLELQVHTGSSNGFYASALSMRWGGRRRWSSRRVAAASSAIPSCRYHDNSYENMKLWHDIRKFWYQRAMI